jgi:hypothetical protein
MFNFVCDHNVTPSFSDDVINKKIIGLHSGKCIMYVHVHAIISYDSYH